MSKEEPGANEWVAAAAKKLKGKSTSDLEVMAIVNFVSEKENSEMIFQAAFEALKKKSRSAYKRVYNKIAEMNDEMETGRGMNSYG